MPRASPKLDPCWTTPGRSVECNASAAGQHCSSPPQPNWHHCCSVPRALLTLKGTAKLHFLPPALIVCQLPQKKREKAFLICAKKKKKVRFQKLFSTLLHPRKVTFTSLILLILISAQLLTFGLFPLYQNSCLFFLDKVSEISLFQSQC